MQDASRHKVACFKPTDEEPGSEANPRGLTLHEDGLGLRVGILPGESSKREVAAYVLDHAGFCGVPGTLMVEVRTELGIKTGSLQEYIECEGEHAGNFAASMVRKFSSLHVK